MFPAGDRNFIDVQIARKAFRTAGGQSHDVLTDFAMRIEAGEVRALVGPSGCGKTTLLRLIIGLDADFQGRIIRPEDMRIGMVFQEPRLLPWRSVRDNLHLAVPDREPAALVKIATSLGLGGHLDHYPGELSLGLERRVALARALAVEPNLLVLDEPFVSLDQALALRLRDELAVLIEQTKMTTLLVTHNFDEAIGLADRITVLAGQPTRIIGEIAIDTPRQAMTPESAIGIKDRITAVLAQNAAQP